MTRGKNGASIISKKGIINIHAPQVKSIDPTGAGDCFNGNLANALLQGNSIEEAVRIAVYSGAYCIQFLGVIDGLPRKQELMNFIDNSRIF
jgi:ribokinase